MKLLILSLAFAAVASAQLYGQQPGQQVEQRFVQLVGQQPENRPIEILRLAQDVNHDGFSYSYKTANGISASAEGTQGPANADGERPIVVKGQYQYPDADGNLIVMKYIADENGFQPVGDHLPVPPPIPVAIQRSLEYIRNNPPKPETTSFGQPQPQAQPQRPAQQQQQYNGGDLQQQQQQQQPQQQYNRGYPQQQQQPQQQYNRGYPQQQQPQQQYN